MEAAEHGYSGSAETPSEATPDARLSHLTLRELGDQITELAGHLNAANQRWLQLIAEFDRRNGWSDGATQSCAHWLSWKCGVNLGAAREKVRVSHALETLPEISAAMRRGELSYSKVRAITRVATPATEAVLLNVALHGTAHHIESLVQKFRRVQEVEELSREQRQHCNRGLTWFHDFDGSLIVKLQLSAENGALFLNAIQTALPEIPLPDDCEDALHVPAGTSKPASGRLVRETQSNRRADVLVVVAESFLKHGAAAMSGGERHQIVVHVDEATLSQRATGRCEHEDGPAMPVETARRLACDCSTVRITEDDQGEPLDVGRKTRSIPPSLRRALRSRDNGCVFPGCNHKRYVDGHHIHHWADGGATKLANLVSLCRFHHRAVHEGGINVERLDDGAWRFTNARGESLDACAPGHTRPMGDVDAMKAANTAHGADVNAGTAATRWRGERMRYGITIDSLLFRSREAEPGITW